MGVSPIRFILAQLWLLCASVRPSIEDSGRILPLLSVDTNEAWECPEDLQEKQRGQLQGLGLSGEGDPCNWKGIRCSLCQVMSIRSDEATGDLSSVKEMTELGRLNLAGSQVTGNVSELAKLKGLEYLGLSGTRVVGNLKELALEGLWGRLKRLDFSQTQVMGDLAELSKLFRLYHLDLSHTQVSGNVAELSKLEGLSSLDLSQTQVSGDVSKLSNLTKLEELRLSQTGVHGNFGVINNMPHLVKADLSGTAVSGDLTRLKEGCCKELRELHLGDTQVRISGYVPIPALQSLNVSGCNLNVSFMDMIYTLGENAITNIFARGCGLTGKVNRQGIPSWFPLWSSLQLLDISGNRLDAVDELFVKLRLDVSHNEIPLRVKPAVIRSAVKSGTDLWMTGTELANRQETITNCSAELQMEEIWTPRETGGYSCHELVRRNLQVTPELFLPELMCACGPGHFGAGTNCSKCPENTFNKHMDRRECQSCPQGGKAPAASQALSACKCPYGAPGNVQNETICRCDRGEALSSDHECRSCSKLHLVCNAPGGFVATAPLEQGYIRLKEPSEEIFECLDLQHCTNSSCAPGLGWDWMTHCNIDGLAHYALHVHKTTVQARRRLSIGLGWAATLVIVAATAWILRRHTPQPSPRTECLLQLIMAQLAALLQLTQLWTVLGGLTPAMNPAVDTAARVTDADNAQGDPLLGYLAALQFTSSEVQNFLALQCLYDGVTVRSLFALATPLVPLLLLIACGCLEVFSRGLGIRVGLKMLTVLFIGGASGSAQLLGCQRTDGAGTPLKEFAFRPLFPHERCDAAMWVDWIGWSTAICYGFFVPCFLGFLFAKQNVIMRKAKILITQTDRDEGKVIVRLQGLESKQSLKDATLSKAKTANLIVTPTTNISRASEDLGVESLVFGADVKEAEVLQRHMMAQMLMERSILEEETDRVMLGAKQLFCKYAKCENVWMEVCTKVAAAALVSVPWRVSARVGLGSIELPCAYVVAVDNLWLCVAITLGMALVIGLAQPFAQPQMNVLQSACFACLALAAVGFRHHMALARLALAVPFVLLVLQLRRPDSPEMLALRLQQEMMNSRAGFVAIGQAPVDATDGWAPECPEEVQAKLRTQLQGLGLSGEGDPCRWKGIECRRCEAVPWQCEECKVVSIHSGEVTGDLSSVKEMTELYSLYLYGNVTGNVSDLAKLKGLWYLGLSGKQVVGNLKELSKLEELMRLDLSQPQVMGDLAELSKLFRLYHLDLSHTQVSGNVAELSQLKILMSLDLSQTQVSGDVSALWNMTELEELRLSQSQVRGNISFIKSMPALLKADLSGTAVFGNLRELRGSCQKLWELHLGDTQVRISRGVLLPALQSLNVSGCNLNVSFIDLFYSLGDNPITSIFARGCGLTGKVDLSQFGLLYPLRSSLQLFDLAANRLDAVDALPGKLRLDVSYNEIPLRVKPDVIRAAAKSETDLWMTDTELANKEEIMAKCSKELQLEEMWISREKGRYSCHELVRPNFRVSPERFLPELMCACGPGHFGAGTNCSKCPEDTFNDQMDQRKCVDCPQGGKAPAGSQALSECKCPYGVPGTFENETMCLCDRGEALTEAQRCVSCSENHLVCSSPMERLATAPVKDGYIRLKEPWEEVFKRFSLGLGCTATLVIVAAIAWSLRRHVPQPSPRTECLLQLIMAQLAALLQLTQLWTVLGGLSPAVDPAANVTDAANDGITVRLMFALATPLIPLLLLIACGCLEVFSRGLGIRVGLKMLTVLFIGGASGSVQLLGCQRTDGAGLFMAPELLAFSLGQLRCSFRAYAWLAACLSGTPLKKFAFRPLFPHEQCEEASWVDWIGWATAICYGFFIPCFLGFLFAKQNVIMRKAKTLITQTARNGGKVESLVFGADVKEAEVLQRHMMAQMLMERSILEEETDRVMLGSKQLFCKYAAPLRFSASGFVGPAKCENVWMEVCTKVAAAALVSVVAVDNLWLCVAITLGMALVIGLAQPFAQPQMNVLQSACFACLALAAVGFRHHMALARLALAVPFMLLVLQLRRPDSPEMLALRLQQEMMNTLSSLRKDLTDLAGRSLRMELEPESSCNGKKSWQLCGTAACCSC
eukprot:s3795_g3.t1